MYRIVNKGENIEVHINGLMEDEGCLELASDIKNAGEAGVKEVILLINSYGGSVKGAWDIVSALKSYDIKITAINEGFAISAASILLAASDYAMAYDYSTAMIHDPLLKDKTLEETEDVEYEFLTKVKDAIMSVYKKRFKIEEKELSNLLTKETSLNAKEQLEIGLVDEIIEKRVKPKLTENMSTIDIYNILEQFNKNGKQMEKVINHFKLSAQSTEEDIIKIIEEKSAELQEAQNKISALDEELKEMKTSNFIMKNGCDGKEDLIKDAVAKYGIEILDTILSFLGEKAEEVEKEPKVENEETTEKEKEEFLNETEEEIIKKEDEILKNELMNIINKANLQLDNSIVENTGNLKELAKEIFDIKGNQLKRIQIQNKNPELYDRLFDIYQEII